MNTCNFKIIPLESTWIIPGQECPEDLCSHGLVRVCLGDTVLEDGCCTSAAAMRMLRTLKEDHIPNTKSFGEQMLPCCGHSMFADKTLQRVDILGCTFGTDYAVVHRDGLVWITTEDGQTFAIDPEDYSREVLAFAQAVEDFYASSAPRKLPKESFERDGFTAFWNEWRWCKAQAEGK